MPLRSDPRADSGTRCLISSTPRVVVTWRTQRGVNLALPPLLERRSLSCAAPRREPPSVCQPSWAVPASGVDRPALSAPGLLPLRVCGRATPSPVTCAYQFYARRLGLAELEDVIELPEKRDLARCCTRCCGGFTLNGVG
jgi:hypothetical protein